MTTALLLALALLGQAPAAGAADAHLRTSSRDAGVGLDPRMVQGAGIDALGVDGGSDSSSAGASESRAEVPGAEDVPGGEGSSSETSQSLVLTADHLRYDTGLRRMVYSGRARLVTREATLLADELQWDDARRVATASGNVRMAMSRGGLYVLIADELSARVERDELAEVTATRGLILKKEGVTAEALLAPQSGEQLRLAGRTTLVLTGTRLERLPGDESWRIDDLSFTPCDCDLAKPSWRISAARGDIDLKDSVASLLSPSVRVFEVPVLWVPWAQLPLSSRRSGLLVPKPDFNANNGFSVDLPLYLTLGESYDVTLSPGYYFGAPRNDKGLLPVDGVRGPRLQTEFRYAPAQGVQGGVKLGLLYDFRPWIPVRGVVGREREPAPAGETEGPARAAGGVRWELTGQHVQELGSKWYGRADFTAVSDGDLPKDLSPELLAQSAQYLKSTAALYRRDDASYAGVDLGLRQDIRWGYGPFRPAWPAREGEPPVSALGPNPIQRLPGLLFALPSTRLWGPLDGSFRAELTRHAPFDGRSGDEGPLAHEGRSILEDGTPVPSQCLAAGLFTPTTPGFGAECPGVSPEAPGQELGYQSDRLYQPGEREPRWRLDLNPRLSSSFALLQHLRVTPSLSLREDLYFGALSQRVSHRGYPLAGVLLGTGLSRSFGVSDAAPKGRWLHLVQPSVEMRYVPVLLGDAPAPYDEIDSALPVRPRFLQAVAEVSQRLYRREGAALRDFARLDVGQGFELGSDGRTPRVAESYLRAGLNWGYFSAGGRTRVDPVTKRVSDLSAGASLAVPSLGSVGGGYTYFYGEPESVTRGIDGLVGNANRVDATRRFIDTLSLSARARLPAGLGLGYDLVLSPGRRLQPPPDPLPIPYNLVLNQTASVIFAPACHCWQAEARLVVNERGEPNIGGMLTIQGFGSFGKTL